MENSWKLTKDSISLIVLQHKDEWMRLLSEVMSLILK